MTHDWQKKSQLSPSWEKESDRCRVVYMSPAAANCRESLLFSSQQQRLCSACLTANGAAARSICTLYYVQVPRSQEGTKLKLGVISKWGMIPFPSNCSFLPTPLLQYWVQLHAFPAVPVLIRFLKYPFQVVPSLKPMVTYRLALGVRLLCSQIFIIKKIGIMVLYSGSGLVPVSELDPI